MSMRILKAGIADAFYDDGRWGYQHIGINPCGVMDEVAMKAANILVGNNGDEAVLEMHFPAPEIAFTKNGLIAFTGADFSATVNNIPLKINRPYFIKKDSILRFLQPVKCARCYLSVSGGYQLDEWLNSYSTHIQCKMGGHHGRTLKAGDEIGFKSKNYYDSILKSKDVIALPFIANVNDLYHNQKINILPGPQYNLLTDQAKKLLSNNAFTIHQQSNRMGYRLQGEALQTLKPLNLISTAVTKGTIQLLPDGQLIILMADHQTTGGYPIIGHVVQSSISCLAQYLPSQKISFHLVNLQQAEAANLSQHQHLLQLQNACNFQLAKYI